MSDVHTLISGTGLKKTFESGIIFPHRTHALKGVDIEILSGQTYVLLGESGSGKTTLGRVLLMLEPPTSGKIIYNGEDITLKTRSELIPFRKRIQIIPQHPEDTFNPRWKLCRSIMEPFMIHKEISINCSKEEKLHELLKLTDLNPDYADRYPHQLSGGELQRAIIARTLAFGPDFIVCDEPTSMLDASVQASIIRLLTDIQKKTGVALLFITHDINLARIIGDRTGVMYNGLIVEEGTGIIERPLHPYTILLTNMKLHSKKSEIVLNSEGCPWRNTCPVTDETCLLNPQLISIFGRNLRCNHPESLYYWTSNNTL